MKYDTDHIDQYLNGKLSESEVKAFEEKMKVDKDFSYEVELQEAAIQVIQYPNFMNEIKNVRNEIAEESGNSTYNQPIERTDEPTTPHQEESETPVVEMKPKRSPIIRRLLTIAASLLLIILAYFIIPKPEHRPMAATTDLIIKFESGTKGQSGKTPLQEGIKLFKNEEYQAAIPFFDQAIRENPNKRTDAQFLKAHALHYLDRKDEAQTVLQSIKKADNEKHYKDAQLILEKYK